LVLRRRLEYDELDESLEKLLLELLEDVLSYDDELVYDVVLDNELLLPELELELELDDDTDDSSSSFFLFAAAAAAAATCANIILGAFLRNSRRPSVSGPSPIDVKKLMA
jgi:hypothetical protein